MGKEKSKGVKGVPNKHIHARVSYLHQAATYLALHVPARAGTTNPKILSDSGLLPDAQAIDAKTSCGPGASNHEVDETTQNGLVDTKPTSIDSNYVKAPASQPQHLSSHLMAVALKSQIRLHPDIKHGICKVCFSPLIEGSTSTKYIENRSRGGRKPWADVLVVKCLSCGTPKRYPIGAKRQQPKAERGFSKGAPTPKEQSAVVEQASDAKTSISDIRTLGVLGRQVPEPQRMES